ncbi:MAG: sialidase family protein, partial [Planctomycetota bacterium]
MVRISIAFVALTALAFHAEVRTAASDGREDGSTGEQPAAPKACHWTLVDGKTNPLGSPLPETIELARIYDDKPPSGDGLGCPDPLLLPDGTLLVVSKRYHCDYPDRKNLARRYKAASTMEIYRSGDGGRTWQFVGPLDPDPDCYDMLVCLFRPDGAPPGFARALVERLVKGDRLQTTWTYFTEDSGRTWSKRQLVFGPDADKGGGLSHAFNGIKNLSDGTLLMPMQRIGPWHRVLGEGYRLLFLPPVVARCRPTSDPKTMGSRRQHWELLEVGHDLPACEISSPVAIVSEPDVVMRPDGSMLLVMRSSCGWMFQSESADNGRTWSRLHRSTFGCTCSKSQLLPLADGTVLLAHHDANNTEGVLKRNPLAVSVSRDGGFTWERTVSIAWRSFWHYGYPSGVELPDGDILYFTRYGPLHDAEAIGVTRVSRRFLDTARISLNAEGCRVEGGLLHLERPEATATAVGRLPLGYPIGTNITCTIQELSGRFQLLSIV